MKYFIYSMVILTGLMSSLGHGKEAMSDAEFEELLQGITGSIDDDVIKIARSGHPKALETLKLFINKPSRQWGPFKELYGFPMKENDKGSIQLTSDSYQIALAIAGDEEAWEEIVEELEGEDLRKRKEAVKKLEKMADAKAIAALGELLHNEDGVPNGEDSFGLLAAYTLNKIVPLPESRALFDNVRITGTERGRRLLPLWKSWWKRNRVRYEKAIAEGMPVEEVSIRLDSLDDLNPKPNDATPPPESSPPPPPSSSPQAEPAAVSPSPAGPPITSRLLWIVGTLIVLVATALIVLRIKSN